jgi:hypothetical protein
MEVHNTFVFGSTYTELPVYFVNVKWVISENVFEET